MSHLLIKKYTELLNKGMHKSAIKLFHEDAVIIDHDGNMREMPAIPHYLSGFGDEITFKLYRINKKNGKFIAIGALHHEKKCVHVKKEFTIEKNRIKSLTISKI